MNPPRRSKDPLSSSSFIFSLIRSVRYGHRYIKRLFLMISLNVAYSAAELLIGLFSGCRKKADRHYTYGQLFLLFMSFSLAVEALHAFVQDESEHNASLMLASWLLSIGVQHAEVLCLGLVSVAVFMLVLPLFGATGGILLQMAPSSIPTTALNKCLRQISAREDVLDVS